jgi:uncharacterized RDD family membrane protein YckC
MSRQPGPSGSLEGHYAGVASRTAAYVVDGTLSFVLFTAGVAALNYIVNLVFEGDPWDDASPLWAVALAVWTFSYYWYCWGMAGKTPGAALLGIRVVRRDGSNLGFRRAFVRTLVFPISLAMFGLGMLGAVFGRERRTWHDIAAGSTVVYDWDARAARLRFLARRGAT